MVRINSKRISAALMSAAVLLSFPATAALNIFACEPEYAALGKELALDNAKISAATTALQDPHFVQARPSLISKMRRADLVICAGADLEIGWLPMLQMKSNNRDVQSTSKGLFYASDHIENLDIPKTVDRSMGDVHVGGNPHLHLDPERLLTVAGALTKKLQALDADNKQQYQQNYDDFSKRWQAAMAQWREQVKPLNGKNIAAYHSSFRYLFEFSGLKQVADLEPKPGLPPTTSHLLEVLKTVESDNVAVVVYTGYQDDKAAKWLSSKTGINAVQLPYTVGGNESSTDLFKLMDEHIRLLTSAFASK